jgi:small subunit ribosomal protein S6
MAVTPKNYELAYLLSPSVPEADILMYAGKLTTLIQESQGVIRHVEEPKKLKLSFPVNKEKNAYFGWTAFTASPEKVIEIDKKAKDQNLLRYLLIHQEEIRTVPQFRPSTARPLKERPIPRETEKPEEKLDLEQLDKRLDEILGK